MPGIETLADLYFVMQKQRSGCKGGRVGKAAWCEDEGVSGQQCVNINNESNR